jgi:hypothetical protein
MLYVAFQVQGEPLITIGDAIESFLNTPDRSTQGRYLTTKQKEVMFAKNATIIRSVPGHPALPSFPVTWQLTRQRWYRAASRSRWNMFIVVFALTLMLTGGLLGWATFSFPGGHSAKTLWSYGLGTVHTQTLIRFWSVSYIYSAESEILASVLIANSPQIVISALYLTLNGLCTTMFLANEWSSFGHHSKMLRVSTPQERQRQTYFLQLPYRIALPLMATSGVLHWLVSQSIFLAVIAEYDVTGALSKYFRTSTCGYSPLAMILFLFAGAGVVIFMVALSRRRFDGSMPLVGSCSTAISAACHAPAWDVDASTKPLQWGAVAGMVSLEGVGHCCFSSGFVTEPVVGQEYAGIPPGTSESL